MSVVLEQNHVILHGVSWPTFQRLLADRGERCGVLLAYDCGTVELHRPSQEHEWVKTTLTQMVQRFLVAARTASNQTAWFKSVVAAVSTQM